ncbi:MAG: NAD(P)-dependent oxidoreductase [Alphaproteobacteria bacterium]|nr:NAD(P)-dependent oxidoreductase [Alphaproteobacteria bacterium]MCB9928392.1 NAD(P)-dependent oxidoreductase [Alphaproteobacteria bacterium]
MRIAYIGIGQMGAGMALCLQRAGFDVIGHDVSPASRDAAAADGLAVTDDLQAAVDGADFLLSSLPNSAIVRAAWLGEAGILACNPKAGAICIDFSTIDAQTMVDVGTACRARGLGVIDAPVSGGPQEAADGSLVLLLGGSDADLARAKPLFDALGSAQLPTGDVGTAKTVKLVNNVMSMGNVLVAAEAFALGEAAGVDPEVLFATLSQSGGRSHHFLKRWPNALQSNWAPGFKMELGEKDVALAIDVARSLRQPMPVASLVREMMTTALAGGYEGHDVVAMLDLYRKLNKSGGRN